MTNATTVPPPEPTFTGPFADALRGFGQLSSWYWGLVDDQKQRSGEMGPIAALARWWALPVVGLAALTAEVVDAASIVANPPRARRQRTSDDFSAPATWLGRQLSIVEPLVNAFGDPLTNGKDEVTVKVTTSCPSARTAAPTVAGLAATAETTPDRAVVHLEATGIPPDRVGVYRGRVGPSIDDTIAVWLVVP